MKATLKLDELTCPSCLQKIESGVGNLPGINQAKVLFNASKVKVDFDEDKINLDQISDQITKLGFDVKEVTQK